MKKYHGSHQDMLIDDALKRIELITTNPNTSISIKAIDLMKEAKRITDWYRKPKKNQHNPDLFSDLPQVNPYKICVEKFKMVIQTKGDWDWQDKFKPTNNLKVTNEYHKDMSPYQYAHELKGKKLKVFRTIIQENFPKLCAEADLVHEMEMHRKKQITASKNNTVPLIKKEEAYLYA